MRKRCAEMEICMSLSHVGQTVWNSYQNRVENLNNQIGWGMYTGQNSTSGFQGMLMSALLSSGMSSLTGGMYGSVFGSSLYPYGVSGSLNSYSNGMQSYVNYLGSRYDGVRIQGVDADQKGGEGMVLYRDGSVSRIEKNGELAEIANPRQTRSRQYALTQYQKQKAARV